MLTSGIFLPEKTIKSIKILKKKNTYCVIEQNLKIVYLSKVREFKTKTLTILLSKKFILKSRRFFQAENRHCPLVVNVANYVADCSCRETLHLVTCKSAFVDDFGSNKYESLFISTNEYIHIYSILYI